MGRAAWNKLDDDDDDDDEIGLPHQHLHLHWSPLFVDTRESYFLFHRYNVLYRFIIDMI